MGHEIDSSWASSDDGVPEQYVPRRGLDMADNGGDGI
jgi:hypothetical protein